MVTSNFFSPIITWWQYLHRNPTYRSHILTSFHFGGSKVFWAKNRHSECDCATGLDPFHIKLYIAKTPTSRRVLLFTDQPRNGTGTTTTCGHLHQLHTSTQTFPIGWPPDFPECSSQPAVSRLSTRPGKVKQPWEDKTNRINQSIKCPKQDSSQQSSCSWFISRVVFNPGIDGSIKVSNGKALNMRQIDQGWQLNKDSMPASCTYLAHMES